MEMLCTYVILGMLLGVTLGQPTPMFTQQQDGKLLVAVLGYEGVTKVLFTVLDERNNFSRAMTLNPADGYWHARIPDVTRTSKINGPHYIIEYHFKNVVHKSEGSIRLNDERTEMRAPTTPRYLNRRATTVFFDDFSSGSIDPSKWTMAVTGDGGGNEEFNMYTPEAANAFVRGNTLFIKPTLTVDHFGDDFLAKGDLNVQDIWGTCTSNVRNGCHLTGAGKIPPIMSAKLMSKGHIRYGKITVQAKMPKGDWLWPAIWMLPTENHYGNWPRSGEIDILESRGNLHYHTKNGQSVGADYDHVNVHYGALWNNKRAQGGEYRRHGSTLADAFHNYWIDWTQNYIRIGIDGHTILAWNTPSQGYWSQGHFTGDNIWASGAKDAPFDRPFLLILNVAVGGRWFSANNVNAGYPQPWGDYSHYKFTEFWNARHLWQPTWHGDDVAMKVRSVRMEQY